MLLKVPPENLARAKAQVPNDDFVSSTFDSDLGVETSKVLLILSTPRSGSTMLCDILRANSVCVTHEYFQPHDYLPLLSERWGCLEEGEVDLVQYFNRLKRFRTSEGGWLGINLHGSHIKNFMSVQSQLQSLEVYCIYLYREDIVSQAVSFSIASQTNQWSSKFSAIADAHYSYDDIDRKVRRIGHLNAANLSYLSCTGYNYLSTSYERICADMDYELERISSFLGEKIGPISMSLKKQRNEKSDLWRVQYVQERLGLIPPTSDKAKKGFWHRLIKS